MTQQELVDRIRAEIIDQNLVIYRDLFANLDSAAISDPYWKRVLGLYSALSEQQRDVLFHIIRQIMVDTTSNMLGVLDGVNWLEGQVEGFKLTMESRSEKLNEGLQDLFLGSEEDEQQQPPSTHAPLSNVRLLSSAVAQGARTIVRRGTAVRRVTIPVPVIGVVDDAAPMPTTPIDFPSSRGFKEFGDELNRGLKSAGYDDVQPVFQGRSVMGNRCRTGEPFDAGHVRDFDIGLASPSLLDKAKALGIPLRSRGMRTGPLNTDQLKALGLSDVASQMSSRAGQPVEKLNL